MIEIHWAVLLIVALGGALASNIWTGRAAMRHIASREAMLHNYLIICLQASKKLGFEDAFIAEINTELATHGMGVVRKKEQIDDNRSS